MVLSTAATPPAAPKENRQTKQTKTILRTLIFLLCERLMPCQRRYGVNIHRYLPLKRRMARHEPAAGLASRMASRRDGWNGEQTGRKAKLQNEPNLELSPNY